MNTDLQLIAHRLNLPTTALAKLDTLPATQLEKLRQQVEHRLSQTGRGTYQKLAGASKILPAGINAKVAERVFGPAMTAGMAGLLEPKSAAKIASKLSPNFIADLVPHLMGNAYIDIMALLPNALIQQVVNILDQRSEALMLATLVDGLPPPTTAQLVQQISDSTLQKVLPLCRKPETIANALACLPPAVRAQQLARVAG